MSCSSGKSPMKQPAENEDSPITDQHCKFASLAGRAARLCRRVIGTIAWIFPLGYLVAVCSAAGILRKELLANSVISRFLQLLLVPPEFVYAKVFAVPLAYRGVDAVVVGCGVLAIVLREVMLAPMRKLEAWAEEAQESAKPNPRLRGKLESGAVADCLCDLVPVRRHGSLSTLGKVGLASQGLTRRPMRAG